MSRVKHGNFISVNLLRINEYFFYSMSLLLACYKDNGKSTQHELAMEFQEQ